MTNALFFDCDCLSSFLWTNNEKILVSLFLGKIIIPRHVYFELSSPNVPHLKYKTDLLISNGQASIGSVDIETEEEEIYKQLTSKPLAGFTKIGSGEASCIALAKCNQGTVASNNLKDIAQYIKYFNLDLVTTGDILVLAFKAGMIDEKQGNIIWASMLSKKRKIGANSFSEYLHRLIK